MKSLIIILLFLVSLVGGMGLSYLIVGFIEHDYLIDDWDRVIRINFVMTSFFMTFLTGWLIWTTSHYLGSIKTR